MAAAPTCVVTVGDVPVFEDASVAVTVRAVAETVETLNVTVAIPEAFVVDVAAENDCPDAAVADQVTTRPDVATALPFASASCAVTVTEPPTVGDVLDTVTRYFDAAPAT